MGRFDWPFVTYAVFLLLLTYLYLMLYDIKRPYLYLMYCFCFLIYFTMAHSIPLRPSYYVHPYALLGYRVSPGGWAPTFKFILNAYPSFYHLHRFSSCLFVLGVIANIPSSVFTLFYILFFSTICLSHYFYYDFPLYVVPLCILRLALRLTCPGSPPPGL